VFVTETDILIPPFWLFLASIQLKNGAELLLSFPRHGSARYMGGALDGDQLGVPEQRMRLQADAA
jgi:hypothetical protein